MTGPAHCLVLLLAACLAAFGGIYRWTLPPIVMGAVLLFALPVLRRGTLADSAATPTHTISSRDTRGLDLSIIAFIVTVALQLLPLPVLLRSLLSPNLARVEAALRPDAALRGAAGPLSLDPSATFHALALLVATVVTYFAARRIFSTGGVRLVCAAIGYLGAIAAVEAIVQRALSPAHIYGFWPPQDPGARPFGPVVNRNHFAAWLMMASAVAGGYLVARVLKRTDDGRGGRTVRQMILTASRTTVAWTAITWLVVTLSVVAAQSRSAMVGLAAAMLTLLRTLASTWTPVFATFGAAFILSVMLLALGESTTTRAAERFAGTLAARDVSRVLIWRETLPIVSDFAVTGVGAGAYGRAMLIYQQTRPPVPHLRSHWYFNHAHNHYLQLAAEGGLLLVGMFLIVAGAFIRVVRCRLRNDGGELRAVRVGAIAGLMGVAVQSLWEVPLTMPAAALLAAMLAALATYKRDATAATWHRGSPSSIRPPGDMREAREGPSRPTCDW